MWMYVRHTIINGLRFIVYSLQFIVYRYEKIIQQSLLDDDSRSLCLCIYSL